MNLKQKYAQIMQDQRLDAVEQIYFARELEHVKAQTYDIVYGQLMARKLFPLNTEAHPGTETIKYNQFDYVGEAKIVSNYATDFPRVDIKGKEFRHPVQSIGDSYGYSIQEIRSSQQAGIRLEANRAAAAKRTMMVKENKIAFFGDSDYGLPGFLSNSSVITGTVPNDGTGPSTTWASKSADLIIRDMMQVANAPFDSTEGVESANTVLLANDQYSYISTTPRAAVSDTTILEFFLAKHPTVTEVIPVGQLSSSIYPASLGFSGNLIVAYDRNPGKLSLEVPQPFEQFAPDKEGLDWVVHCHERISGVIIPYPKSVAIYDGLT